MCLNSYWKTIKANIFGQYHLSYSLCRVILSWAPVFYSERLQLHYYLTSVTSFENLMEIFFNSFDKLRHPFPMCMCLRTMNRVHITTFIFQLYLFLFRLTTLNFDSITWQLQTDILKTCGGTVDQWQAQDCSLRKKLYRIFYHAWWVA
jgi:hypothetical protein